MHLISLIFYDYEIQNFLMNQKFSEDLKSKKILLKNNLANYKKKINFLILLQKDFLFSILED